jgi:acyl-coenzyme A synthetase/AMP-(fatty) acid ligase/acyl carrier protein
MRILVGGEPLTNNIAVILSQITKKIFNTYGPSETTIWSTCARIKSEISIGVPIANTICTVLDKLHQPVPPMCRGDLYIGGSGVCVGYLNRPEINAEKFIMLNGKRYYSTGDVVIYTGKSFSYIGRNDFQIKINGHRIEIGEIISVLEQFTSVKNVAIKHIVHKTNTYLVAYIIANQIINQACILDFAREKLPSYMVPNFLIQLPRFPETLNGKIDMNKLPSPFESSDKIKFINTDVIVKPTNEVETKMYEICNDILGINEFSIDESLFNFGLQSIMIYRFIAKIKEIFGVILTTTQFIKNSTVAMCARLIKELFERLA